MQQATKKCLELLSRRARTRAELQSALHRAGHPPQVIAQSLATVEKLGYLNDAKFAAERAESLVRNRHLAPEAIKRRLLQHGVTEAVADKAASGSSAELEQRARSLLEQRQLLPPIQDARVYARAARLLSGRGYPEDVVETVLGPPPDEGVP